MNPSDAPCVNHEYCKNVVWAREGKADAVFCEACEKLVDAVLHKSPLPEACPICYTEKPVYWIFPGCTTSHAFCGDCLDVLLIGEAYVCGTLCTYPAQERYHHPSHLATSLRTHCGGNLMMFPDTEAVVIRPSCPLCPYEDKKTK